MFGSYFGGINMNNFCFHGFLGSQLCSQKMRDPRDRRVMNLTWFGPNHATVEPIAPTAIEARFINPNMTFALSPLVILGGSAVSDFALDGLIEEAGAYRHP